MSLLNDVLRDLEERRAREGSGPEHALSGLLPEGRRRRRSWRRPWPWALASLGLAVGLLWISWPGSWPVAWPDPATAIPKLPEVSAASPANAVEEQAVPASIPAQPWPEVAEPDRELDSAEESAAEAIAAAEHELEELARAHGPAPAPRWEPVAEPVLEVRERPLPPEKLAERRYREAQRLEQAGQVHAARRLLGSNLETRPNHLASRLALASLLARTGELARADMLLAKGLSLAPGHPPFLLMQARILVEQGDVAQAIELLEHSAASLTAVPEAHAFLAALYQQGGRHALAQQHYAYALGLDRNVAPWWMGIGISFEATGHQAEAIEAFRRARRSGSLDAGSRRYVESRLADLARRAP